MAKASANAIEVKGDEAVDHRLSANKPDENALRYPHGDAVPAGADVIEVADRIYWARIPLPWSLDHINVYLFDDGDSWTIIDTGAQGDTGRDTWAKIIDGFLGEKPISRVIATHLHPDHLGLAGWLVKNHSAEFFITQAEYLLARTLWLDVPDEFPQTELDHLFSAGVDRSYEPMIRKAGFGNFRRGVHELPPQYHRLEDGSEMTIAGRRWRVVVGRGHSPEHACLFCLDEPLMIGGDQILPAITSNVSVYAREPLANPLAHWLSSLNRMRALPGDPLVLPSHGKVFFGLQERLNALIQSHTDKLVRLHEWCEKPRTPVKTFRALYRRKIEGLDFYLALGEAIAHLHLLESLGLMDRSQKDGLNWFQSKGAVDAENLITAIDRLPGVAMRDLGDFFD